MLLEVKGLRQIIVKFRAEKSLCTFLLSNNKHKHKQKAHFIQLHNAVQNFGKKISQGTCFFTVVHACTKSLNEALQKLSQSFKLHLVMWTI